MFALLLVTTTYHASTAVLSVVTEQAQQGVTTANGCVNAMALVMVTLIQIWHH
jgi:hypothetical protein